MISIHPHFNIKDGNMEKCIAILEKNLVLTKNNVPICFFFNITKSGLDKFYVREAYKEGLDKFYVREAYKEGAGALFYLKNMGHKIPKLLK